MYLLVLECFSSVCAFVCCCVCVVGLGVSCAVSSPRVIPSLRDEVCVSIHAGARRSAVITREGGTTQKQHTSNTKQQAQGTCIEIEAEAT